MKLRCKPGDLAIVIHDTPECATNIGRVVQVRGPLQFNPNYRHHCWLIKPVRRGGWMVNRNGRISSERATWNSLVEHPDAWMLPIRPEELDHYIEQAARDLEQFLETLNTAPQKHITDVEEANRVARDKGWRIRCIEEGAA